jgi:hypothetical protein
VIAFEDATPIPEHIHMLHVIIHLVRPPPPPPPLVCGVMCAIV